jgi:hypothetical protein
MFQARRFSPLLSAAVLAVLLGTGLAGSRVIAEDSPFVPDGFGGTDTPAGAPSALDRFEFRGVVTIGADTYVTLVDTTLRRTLTAALGDTIDGVTVAGFQSENGSILLTAGGQSKRLVLPDARIVAVTSAPVPGLQPSVAASPEVDSAGRMQEVAREIQRRREMRRKMLEAQTPSVAPAPTR